MRKTGRYAKMYDKLTSTYLKSNIYNEGVFKDGGAFLMAVGVDYSF